VHIGGSYSPLKDILAIMRKGDVLTHCYTGDPHGVLDEGGEILPEVWEARQRGILFAVGHATTRFSFKVAEKCLREKFLPDVISCGNSAPSVAGPTFDMPTTLSKFLLLGLSVDKVIELVTIRPAHVFNFGMELGTLRPGSAADIAISELREGTFAFADGRGETRLGRQKLVNLASIRDGKLFVNQNEGWIDY
jgi:dihydroorotase